MTEDTTTRSTTTCETSLVSRLRVIGVYTLLQAVGSFASGSVSAVIEALASHSAVDPAPNIVDGVWFVDLAITSLTGISIFFVQARKRRLGYALTAPVIALLLSLIEFVVFRSRQSAVTSTPLVVSGMICWNLICMLIGGLAGGAFRSTPANPRLERP